MTVSVEKSAMIVDEKSSLSNRICLISWLSFWTLSFEGAGDDGVIGVEEAEGWGDEEALKGTDFVAIGGGDEDAMKITDIVADGGGGWLARASEARQQLFYRKIAAYMRA